MLELKVRRGEGTIADGVRQLSAYLDTLGEPEGCLAVFDRRRGQRWADKLFITERAGTRAAHLFVRRVARRLCTTLDLA